ncbi:MAG: GTPase ObgE [Actinomycetia bacterium]|nr:GTPase ObgE [Actinomycetes bacterium]
MFVDSVRVHLRAGDGGNGMVSFERRRGKPRGKPMGGSGGSGGDVVVRADLSIGTLFRYQRSPHHAAERGANGADRVRHGRRGDPLVLLAPPGTSVYDEAGVLLADLVAEGQEVTLLRGGRGGRGNAALVSPSHRVPAVGEKGERGPGGWFRLEMKLQADAALVGFPNAGKSTLLSRVSAARPKIADYPFTTLTPNLGVVGIDGDEFTMADVPGLIQGAAEGRGLGHTFLRHVERASVLVILLDPSPMAEVEPGGQLDALLGELERYSPALAERPRVVAVNKADLEEAGEVADAIPGSFLISAVTGQGLRGFLRGVKQLIVRARETAAPREGFMLHRPHQRGFVVSRTEAGWSVEGVAAERAVAFGDLDAPEAARLASSRLDRIGVSRALREAGARHGDTVLIGETELQYTDPDAGGWE